MNATLCHEAYEVNTSSYILLVWSLLSILNVSGITATLHVIRLLCSSQVQIFHTHLRILFVNLSFGLVLRSAFTLFRAVHHIAKAVVLQDKCDFLQDSYYCMVQARINLTPFNSCVYTYLAVAIERTYATWTYRSYESTRHSFLCALLVAATWVHPTIELSDTLRRDASLPRERSYCSALTARPIVLSQVVNNQIIICFICLIAFIVIWIICAKKKRITITVQEHTLSSRFQLLENVRATQIILPNSILFSIVTLLNISFLYLLEISKQHHGLRDFAIFKETMSLTVPIYINAYAWIFILRCPQLAKRTIVVRRLRRFTKPVVDECETPNDHFRMLVSYWG